MKYRLIIATIVLSFNCQAGSLKTIADTKILCQAAADSFGAGNAKESFQLLKKILASASRRN
ncbi:MAG: hypothetical protein ACI8VC_000670 [Candidatus Endobugula sp.]|jgi:hypothetical protein